MFPHLIRVPLSATGGGTLIRPSPGVDAPTVWGKCHEVTKGDGVVNLKVRSTINRTFLRYPPSFREESIFLSLSYGLHLEQGVY